MTCVSKDVGARYIWRFLLKVRRQKITEAHIDSCRRLVNLQAVLPISLLSSLQARYSSCICRPTAPQMF